MINLLRTRLKRALKSDRSRKPVASSAAANDKPASNQKASTPDQIAEPISAPNPQSVESAPMTLAEKSENWLRRDLSQLSRSWASVRRNTSDLTSLKKLRLAIHNLKGMAGSYGYPAISRLAGSLDTFLKSNAWRSNTALIDLHLAACQAAANAGPAPNGQIDKASIAVCDILIKQVDKLVSVPGQRCALTHHAVE